MKNNQSTFLLVGVLLLCTVMTALLLLFYNRSMRNLADVGMKAQQISQAVPPLMDSLIKEAAEYTKKSPDLVPTMQALSLMPNNQAAPAPATKPLNK